MIKVFIVGSVIQDFGVKTSRNGREYRRFIVHAYRNESPFTPQRIMVVAWADECQLEDRFTLRDWLYIEGEITVRRDSHSDDPDKYYYEIVAQDIALLADEHESLPMPDYCIRFLKYGWRQRDGHRK